MLPRGTLDIGWRDLAVALLACVVPSTPRTAHERVAQAWPAADAGASQVLCTLSVRSGFDSLLTALRLPPGSEVLVSALTIADMARILEEHSLVAVPVDLDLDTLSVTVPDLERARTPRTRALLIAHVFGARNPLDEIGDFARRHGLLLVEDCAQCYTGADYVGDPASDVAMFSFGPIKTNTALGGAVLRVNDPDLRSAVLEVQARQPLQGRAEYARKVLKFGVVKVVSLPAAYGLLARVCRMLGTNHDVVISQALRGFAGPAFFDKIRRRPSEPLLALLERRLRAVDQGPVQRRVVAARRARDQLGTVAQVGTSARDHSHWLFPIISTDPDRLTRRLWARGFDATRGQTSLTALHPPAGRPQLAPRATELAERVVYLPVPVAAEHGQLGRLVHAVLELEPR